MIDKLIHLAFERRIETIRSKNQIALLASRWPPSVDSGYSVDMIVFPIHHRQWGFEFGANLPKQQPQAVDRVPIQDQVSILGDKD
ncbi:MAG: hypothetical protein AUF67_08715 [Acidobacteria bacterium 13_1_20CM_58_21]|nr:MAG: hypothetical protein AUF67_08715 [Acidobacteria bacterium 13_1_20CM_58_21]